jgi:hypothetical protein
VSWPVNSSLSCHVTDWYLFSAPTAAVPSEDQALSAATPPEPATKKEEKENRTTPTDSGVVKASKGVIPRESVDCIRYLQQLVTAQASRNREFEGQLERCHLQDPDAVGKGGGESADNMGLVLHKDVDSLRWFARRTALKTARQLRGW